MAKLTARAAQAWVPYQDLSPNQGNPLERGRPNREWFGSSPASGYVQSLLERFEERNPEAALELAFIANEGKWSTGWRELGRLAEEILG